MSSRSEPVVLIAEDNEDDLFMLRRAFDHIGVRVPIQVVSNGEEAIAYLAGNRKFANRDEYPLPDIVLLDLKMPRKNGFDVLSWWRVQHNLGAIRMVVLTTSEAIRDINEAYKLGAASFLVKPLNFNEFRTTIFAMYDFWRNNLRGEASREEKSAEPDGNGAGSR